VAPAGPAVERLVEILRRLRAPNGCPWDREQTLASLKKYLLEECYEELEAVDRGDPDRIREELGDVLLQVVFQSQICAEAGWFDFGDVAETLAEKLIRRHPHVFGDVTVRDANEVVQNWERLKRNEEADSLVPKSAMDGVPRTLPALHRAQQIQRRAARCGFDWPTPQGVLEKLEEEVRELREAAQTGSRERMTEELGDLLFTIVNLARAWDLEAEELLQNATDKFVQRFRRMEALAARDGHPLDGRSLEELDRLWEQAKREESSSPGTASE